MSPDIFKTKIIPLFDKGEKVFLIVIDNFRLDQWRVLAEEIGEMFDFEEDFYTKHPAYLDIYALKVIFSGFMSQQIAKMFPDVWVDEDEDEGKNLIEASLIKTQIERYRRHDTFSSHKINDFNGGEKLIQ